MSPLSLQRVPVLVALTASAFAFGCATLPAPDAATVAAAAVAANAATAAASTNAAPSAGAVATPALAPGAARPSSNTPAIAAAAAAAAAAVAGQQKPFAEVVKDAREQPGFFNLYSKEEKVWLEIKPEQFDRPFFLQANRTHSIGDREPLRSPMLRSYIVEFHRLGSLVQLIARNSQFFATAGTPLARAVRESTSDSLLSAVPVASQPHPEKKSILIDANALLLADIPGGSSALEAAYHIAYGFDARNSSFTALHNTADLTGFAVSAHYSVPKLPPAPSMTSSSHSAPPGHLEDERSLFLGYYYSLAKLPEAMTPRVADDRIGHFMARRWDFSSDSNAFPEVYYVKRWRLEKKDPDAEMSEPKVPIVYWLDRNIPEKYRETIKAGVLEWNKAFEKLGFKNAIQVEVQPEDAQFSTADARHASIRWVVRDEPGAFAIGPSRADPRTGEILDADIEIEDGWTRVPRRQVSEQFPPRVAQVARAARDTTFCEYGDVAMDELAFALDLLVARGEIAPDSPEAEKYVLATLKDVVTHEVGHTLGLQHNFRASTIYTQKQLSDASFTTANGIGGSVMDYNAINLALQDGRLKPGESYELLRRNFLAGLTQLSNAGMVCAKYVGGVVYVRDHAGSGRDPFTPVPAAKQRAALKLIADGLLSVDSFRLRPEFVRRLTVDQFDRYRDDAGLSAITPDLVLTTRMLGVQRAMLDQLMSDSVATRIAEGEFRQSRDSQGFRLSELYDTLQDAVWSELKTGRDISSFRRNLQREYMRRIASTLLRPSQSVQADARALQRENAKQLLAQIKVTKSKSVYSKEARAHLAECENTLDEALKAPMMRPGV